MPGAVEHAPAKVNLALHVLVRRPDGYHELDSLVAFASVGDALAGEVAAGLTLALDGPFAGGLPDGPDNLVLRAAVSIRPEGAGAALRLTKRLPVASGLGGGSADAAAALRLLARLWGVPLPAPAAQVALGADVPACLASRPVRMRGIGERLDPLDLPPFWMVLANPGIPVATAAVFRALDPAARAPLPDPPRFESAGSLFAFLAGQRNDLEAPAALIAPAIGEAKAALAAQAGCRLARMAGSGATCFGLFSAEAPARAAASALGLARPEWWIAAAAAGGSAAAGSADPGASG